jgi:hypothetical protein
LTSKLKILLRRRDTEPATQALPAPQESDLETAARDHETFEARLASAEEIAQQMLRKVRDDAIVYTEALRALAAVHTQAADRIEHRFL